MKGVYIVLLLSLGFVMSCAGTAPVQPEKTQLQKRQFQTRKYDVQDDLVVLKAVANALQDEGFIIDEAEPDLGIITASKEVDIENTGAKLVAIFFAGVHGRWAKNNIIESSVNVSGHGEQTKVRVIFQVKSMNNKGEVMKVLQIEDETYYQNFFAKVDKSIFIEKEDI